MAEDENHGWRKKAGYAMATLLAFPILVPATEPMLKDNLLLRFAVVAGCLTVGAALVWGVRRPRKPRPEESQALESVTAALAKAVEGQWLNEATELGFAPHSSRLIDVRWTCPRERGSKLRERRGTLTQLPRLLDRPEIRQLVILGEAETGKTAAAVYLTLAMLGARDRTAPVPVLFPLADWDPHTTHLDDWLAAGLADQHPWLKSDRHGSDLPRRLLRSGLVVPILDAFDEILGRTPEAADAKRRAVLRSVRESTLPRMAISSRKDEFLRAENEATWLDRAAVVELQKLTSGQIKQFLRAAVPAAKRTRWAPVLADINRGSVIAEALSTPLVLALVPEVYAVGDPGELTRFTDAAPLKEHVLREFAPTRFASTLRAQDRRAGRRRRAEAMRWLRFLADRTRHGDKWEPISWWEFSAFARTPTRLTAALLAVAATVASFGFGMSVFLEAVGLETTLAWWLGCLIGLGSGIALGSACYWNAPPAPSETQFEVDRDHLMAALKSGLPLFFFVAMLGLVFLDLATSLIFALAFAVPVSVLYAVVAPDPEPIATNPDLLLRRDLRVGYVFGVGYGAPAFVVGYLVSGNLWLSAIITAATVVAGGLFYGLQWMFALQRRKAGAAAFVHLGLAVLFLAPRRLPWRVMRFLREAHRVGVLRRDAGGTYKFRHSGVAAAIAAWEPTPPSGLPHPALEQKGTEPLPNVEG